MATTMPPSPSIPYAYPMFSDYVFFNEYHDPDDGQDDPFLLFPYTGLDTVCPGLLWPDAVPVPFLLTPAGLGRAPSPTPTMSSEDDPAVTTMAHPPKPQPQPLQQHQAPLSAPLSTTPLRSSDHNNNNNNNSASNSDVMRSGPILGSSKLSDEPMSTGTSEQSSAMPTPSPMSAPASNGGASHHHHHPNSNRPSRWTKARSTSTESSISLSGMTTLGSMYNQDGFPNYPASSDDDGDVARIAADDAAIAKQLALTDEAVRQINGTPSVVQARNLGNMMPNTPSANAYELPRSMAAFVHRQPSSGEDGRELKTGRSFVSSGSSTSSEESEHLASVQWVTSVSQPSSATYSNYPFYYTGNNGNNGNSNAGANNGQTASPKMPPPATTNTRKLNSPRRNGAGGGRPSSSGSGPATPNAMQPSALPSSALPPGASGDTPVENEDDDQTIGGPNREGSPSSSSASGLDLLSHAAAHHERSRYSTYIKRKAGAEAVAQWRESGIPSGAARPDGQGYSNSPGYDSTPSDGQQQGNGGSSEPPKKRRRSEMQLETPDSRLRNPPSNPSEHESDYESGGSASDSEYQSGKRGRRPSKGKHKIRVRATLPMPSGSSAGGGTPSTKDPSSPTAPKKQAAKPRRSSGTSEGKPGGLGPNGVQCEYVNPLPPYQRCPDVFTRKYDIPRHMARHARREGDLVAEGKLPEEKALLWKTIRDKPRIRCKTCGEYFTRQDALKRHQNKQHH